MRRREPLPRRGGSGSRFVRRQSRRALNPGWRRAQRAESREAGHRPAFSRRARRRCGVRRRGLGPWFYRLDRSRFPAGGNRLLVRVPAKSARFKTRQAARTTRRISGSGPSARFLAACTPPLRSSEEGLGSLVLPFGQEPLPRRGNRLLFRVPAKSARFKTRQAARTTRRMSGSGPSARFLAACTPSCGVRKKGLGSCFACRQSRRASKPGKQRAQRAECQEAGLRPASSRRARRRCGVRKKGLGSWFYRLDGSRSLQRGKRLPFCVSAKSARFKTRPAARTTRRISGRGLASPPPRRQRLPFLPHSALRSTSSPSGPCAICWKPAFSYRRTGPA